MKLTDSKWFSYFRIGLAGGCVCALPLAAAPVVRTIPWSPTNPLIPHDSISGRQTTVKGVCDVAGSNIQYTWNFGDGSPTVSGTVSDRYAIEAQHTYTGAAGTVFTARLTVVDTSSGTSGSASYFVALQDVSTRADKLKTEVNMAIDAGLWYLHKSMNRFDSGGIPVGDWRTSRYGGYAYDSYIACSAANVNAFEVNGHLESGSPDNPYTETVARGLRRLFEYLSTSTVGVQVNGHCTFTPDGNNNGVGNGYKIELTQDYDWYQMGMLMDAIVASGTPGAVAITGEVPSGTDPGVLGRQYDDIVQDMADGYMWAQYDGSPGGGWRYSANQSPDNSACQWAAIGIIAAERRWGIYIHPCVKSWNLDWLVYTQNANGAFGYTSSTYFPWGAYATTPSGMVQLVMDGIGRGETGPGGWPSWDQCETYLRDRFGNTGGPSSAIKDYYYGLFSFVKSMLLHDPDEDGIDDPIQLLQSQTPGVPPLDWYAAEASYGDPTDGVARTLIDDQNAGGYWRGHQVDSRQYSFETAWAIQMLRATVFDPGTPVAVAKAIPNPGVVGQTIIVDGTDSFHQAGGRSIVQWEWDIDGDGAFDVDGPVVALTFPAVAAYPITLRVSDDGSPVKTDLDTVTVRITSPPIEPTAVPAGPYVFCPSAQPWFLDGRRSVNPDEGAHEVGPNPGDTIQEYAWDLDGDLDFDDAFGATVDVTSYFQALGPGAYLVQLRVTDTTSQSFPASGAGDLSHTASAQVFVKAVGDPQCDCVTLSLDSVVEKTVTLSWTDHALASFYSIYRGTSAGGPYLWLDSTTETTYADDDGLSGTTYYYVVRPAALNSDEYCQSNEIEATPQCSPPTVIASRTTEVAGPSLLYWKLSADSGCYGRAQREIYVEDTGSSLAVGPLAIDTIVRIDRVPAGWPAFSYAFPPSYGFEIGLWVEGEAMIYAVDPAGQTSLPVVITPWYHQGWSAR
ncbi:MAG: PKD domain-containing protein [Verrucomicrobiales bacterium]|nr:PKD domain-containing protein [Verrucomicrobiales bacterium]